MASTSRNGITLHYEVSGSGPPIVLTHSFLCDGAMFRHQVTALERNHRVINIDLRGHGRSGPSDAPFTIYDLVDDVCAVLDAERVASAVWMGLSIGGFLAEDGAEHDAQKGCACATAALAPDSTATSTAALAEVSIQCRRITSR